MSLRGALTSYNSSWWIRDICARRRDVAMKKRAALLAAAAAAIACNSAVEPIPPKITAFRAYYCAVPNAATCESRGDPIPAGTLPPRSEAFQVWAFYQGWVTTHYR